MMSVRTPALFAVAATLFLIGAASVSHADDRRTVTVSAAATATVEPDMAVVATGIVSDAPTAREALTRNSSGMEKLIGTLKALGIDAKDISTFGFQVDPQYANHRDGKASTIAGYRVVNQVRVTVRDLKRLGEVLDQAVSAGANQASGIEFQVSTEETLRDNARREAIATARRRGELYASAAGAELGKVMTIHEDGGTMGPRPMMAGRAAMASVPIEPGSQSLEVRVTVTYELK